MISALHVSTKLKNAKLHGEWLCERRKGFSYFIMTYKFILMYMYAPPVLQCANSYISDKYSEVDHT